MIYNGVVYFPTEKDLNGNGWTYAIGEGYGLPPTATTPTCSTDGVNFSACTNLAFGSLLSYVRTTCTPKSSLIDSAKFTLTSPSGVVYTNLKSQQVASDDYTLQAPYGMTVSGNWVLSVTCQDSAGNTAIADTNWSIGSAPVSDLQKLSIYDGTARFHATSFEENTLEIGSIAEDANIDFLSSGPLFIRPNATEPNTYFEGLPGLPYQRLSINSDSDGQPALEATGLGQLNQSWIGAGVHGRFNGQTYNSGGSAVYGEITSCPFGRNCFGGYFSNLVSGPAVIVTNNSDANPTLESRNDGGGLAGQFIGSIQSTKDVSADNNIPDNCSWHPISESGVCPSGEISNAFRFTGNDVSEYQCCKL
jgi:hypothetical protein